MSEQPTPSIRKIVATFEFDLRKAPLLKLREFSNAGGMEVLDVFRKELRFLKLTVPIFFNPYFMSYYILSERFYVRITNSQYSETRL